MAAVAFLLLSYKGYDLRDDWISNVAGLGALLLALVRMPLSSPGPAEPAPLRGVFPVLRRDCHHDALAVPVRHRRSGSTQLPSKELDGGWRRRRKWIYFVCGCLGIIFFVVALVMHCSEVTSRWFFWVETGAVYSFAVAWVTKALGTKTALE